MTSVFLHAQQSTQATIDRDYPEWHHGRQHYALWYIEILDPALTHYLQQLRQQFADLLYQPNARQFHISLFICGFRASAPAQYCDDFLDVQLQQQHMDLTHAAVRRFQLSTGRIRSFNSALFLEVLDPDQHLQTLRSILSASANEIAAPRYCAHITLGVYRDAYPYTLVHDRIAACEQQAFELSVQQLTFGQYQAQQLQGQLDPQQYFQLDLDAT